MGGKLAGGDWRTVEPILLETLAFVDAVVSNSTDRKASSLEPSGHPLDLSVPG